MSTLSPVALMAHNPGTMTGDGNITYLLPGAAGGASLIDAGVGDMHHLESLAHELAARRRVLGAVLVTHAHPDHASGAPAIAAWHPAATFFKFPWPERDGRYPVSWRPLADGDVLRIGDEKLTVLHTPGHSPDHVVFWHESSRTAFTGDLVIENGSVMIRWSGGGNVSDYLASLRRIAGLNPFRLLPAHGPIIQEPARVLSSYIEHRLRRERQVVDALKSGPATVRVIAESIYDGLHPPVVEAAEDSVRAHLEKLKSEGQASPDADDRWSLRR